MSIFCLISLTCAPTPPQAFCYKKGEGRCNSDMSIPIPKTSLIWASPSYVTLAIWVGVRVKGGAYITRVLVMGMPISLWQREGKGHGEEVGARKGRQKGENGFTSPFHGLLPFATAPVTRVSRSPLCQIRCAWRGGRPCIVMIKLSSRL